MLVIPDGTSTRLLSPDSPETWDERSDLVFLELFTVFFLVVRSIKLLGMLEGSMVGQLLCMRRQLIGGLELFRE